MGVVIQRADRDDLDVIVVRRLDFLRAVRGSDVEMSVEFVGATRRFVTTEFDAGRLHSWIAWDADSDECVGLVSVLLWARPPRPDAAATHNGYIVNMFVEPDRQGTGIGRSLLDVCLASRHELGVDRFLLHTTEAGRELYESIGFASNSALIEWVSD